jgi:hypothetical protein
MASAFSRSLADQRGGAESLATSCLRLRPMPTACRTPEPRQKMRSQRPLRRPHFHSPARQRASESYSSSASSPCLKYKDGRVGNYKALYERVAKRIAVNRERVHPALHQNRACCCPLHICSLLLAAAH